MLFFPLVGLDLDRSVLVKILGDRHSLLILSSCLSRKHSVLDMSRRHDIPIAVCYRKVNSLVKLNILKYVDSQLTIEGKRVKTYITNVKKAELSFEEDKVKLSIKFKDLENIDVVIT